MHKKLMNLSIKTRYYVIGALILAAGLGFWYFRSGGETAPEYTEAILGNVVQEVSVTGKVNPAQTLNLAFEKSGKVRYIPVAVGGRVSPGTLLVELDSSSLAADLREAEASLEIARIRLTEAKKGVRAEEIGIYEAKVSSARFAEEDARKNIFGKISDAFSKADDAVRVKVDQFIINPRGSNPELTFRSPQSSLETALLTERVKIEEVLNSWSKSVIDLSLDGDFDIYVSESTSNLYRIRAFLDNAALILNSASPSAYLSQTTLDGYRADVSAARTNANTALSNIIAADEKLRAAESALVVSEQELALKRAGSTSEEIAAAEAEERKVSAAADKLRVEISKTRLISTISGVVSAVKIEEGEIVSANASIITLISAAQFEIESNIPEADIAKVTVGNQARVTLDAYGSDVEFPAKVVEIEPAETVLEGVATYKTTLYFLQKDDRIRSGMTANIDILTAEKNNVLIIPQRAVLNKEAGKFVRILNDDGTFKEIEVLTGLRGSDGNTEILDGIKEGDKVVTYINE